MNMNRKHLVCLELTILPSQVLGRNLYNLIAPRYIVSAAPRILSKATWIIQEELKMRSNLGENARIFAAEKKRKETKQK